jgi:YVTN family beta-propeller protein
VSRRLSLVLSLGLVALLAVTAPGARTESARLPGQRGTLWVVNKTLNNVTAFDGASGTIVATVPVGRNPNSVVVARLKAYVTNEDSNDVTVISTMSHTVVTTIPVPSRPHHIRRNRDGSRVYVAEYNANKVAVIDTGTDKLVNEITADTDTNAKTHSTWLTRDGKWLLAANEATNSVTILDLASGAIVGTVPTGGPPSEVLATPDGRTAYVSLRAGAIKVVDLVTRAVVASLTLPAPADTLQLTPDGNRLAVALRGEPAQLSVVDTKSLTIVQTIDLAGEGTIAGHNWMSANGRYSFVAYAGGTTPGVAVVDHQSGKVVQTLAYPGGGQPHGVYYDDPAATEGPALTLGPSTVRVVRNQVTITVACSADAVGLCRGDLSLAGGNQPFTLRPATSASIHLRVSGETLKRLARIKRLSVVATAVATDQLGNSRKTTRRINLLAPLKPR